MYEQKNGENSRCVFMAFRLLFNDSHGRMLSLHSLVYN